MDFLDIRKKAKERAQARAAADAAAKERAPPAFPHAPPSMESVQRAAAELSAAAAPDRRAPSDAPIVTDADLLEGALAARLQGLPAPGEPPPRPSDAVGATDDTRFTTWRPGAGAPPDVGEPVGGGIADLLIPRAEDFAVVAPSLGAPLPHLHPHAAAGALAHPHAAAAEDPLDEFFFRPDETAPALPEIAAAEPLPPLEAEGLAREEFLTFMLGAEEYAVAIERVREVVRSPPITEVPRAPVHILGVVTVRGEVVAVVDPRRRLGLRPVPIVAGEAKIVIVDAGDGPCGLHVDRVASVVRLRPGSIEPCPQGIAGECSEFLAGIGREGDRLFTVLDLGALLRPASAREAHARRADAGR